MEELFVFADAPGHGDRWTTAISTRDLIAMHPALHDFGDVGDDVGESRELWLEEAVEAGLQRYGCDTFSRLYIDVLGRIDEMVCEALHDSVLAMQAILNRPGAARQLAQREKTLLDQILDDEQGVARYVAGPMLELRYQRPIARLRTLYALRGARLGRGLPFGVDASQILEDAFGGEAFVIDFLGMKEQVARTVDAVSLACRNFARRDLAQLYRAIFSDVMAGLTRKISVNRRFQRFVIGGWVLPEVRRRQTLRRLCTEEATSVDIMPIERGAAESGGNEWGERHAAHEDRSGFHPF
ncbi:hypothetical protein DV096_11815 [Bradymonadaceae bacterium TMQ3]|uniref:Uncharacterized protein n=1 Tax=Lujinxingia sediminis TaxID=2480984 RepID=A0ABY0CSP8_9DELT|nr:hypothetical protein [Lujinxingia sediminis]RDV37797.1 hypothetical protein DV096_11815 [Bradymonadaceae bacterium TMQ3]RVU43202.1 hypothetical protein EA187_13405 [Lujinxingia sediminis]TXC75419.1 hypothetical protein FRC91_11935 [Bradymonadales bacterium TMQ1]